MRGPFSSPARWGASAAVWACVLAGCPQPPASPAASGSSERDGGSAPRSAAPGPGQPAALLLTRTELLWLERGVALELPPERPLVDMFTDPSGTLHLLSATKLHALREGAFVEQAEFGELARAGALGPVHGAALGPEGQLYLAGARGIAWREQDAWKLSESAELGYAAGTELELGFDAEGRIWVIGPERAIYRDAQTVGPWRETDKSTLGFGFDFGQAQPSSLGPVHVNNDHRLTRIYPDLLDSVLVDPRQKLDYELLALAPSAHALVATRSCELARVNPRPPTKIWRLAAQDYACEDAEALALDGQLRAWVASRAGVTVLDPHGATLHTFAASEEPARRLLVLGDGPALSGPGEP